MRHLQPGPLKTTLKIEPLIGLRAIQDRLVATHLLGDEIEGLDELQAQFLALLVFRDGDVFDMAC